jgi:hypothetical protein
MRMPTALLPSSPARARHAAILLIIFCIQLFLQPLAFAEEVGSANDTKEVSDLPEAASASNLSIDQAQAAESEPEEGPVVQEEETGSMPLIICINEVQWMGTDLSTADEWLEVMAMGAESVRQSLADWTIAIVKDGGVEQVIARFEAAHDIAAGEYRVVSNYPADRSRLRREPYVVSSSMSLPNTKLLLRLRDAEGRLIDEVDDGVGVPFAGANPSGGIKAAMERIDCAAPGTMKENWRTATTARGLDPDALVLGTPGFPNGTMEPVDDEAPDDATSLRARSFSGSIFLDWQRSVSPDLARQILTILDASGAVLQQTEWSHTVSDLTVQVPAGAAQVTHRSVDESGNESPGVSIQIEPLQMLKISEVLPDPPGPDIHEWFEVMNPNEDPLDLHGWSVGRGTARYYFPPGTGSFLPPGEHRTLFPAETKLTLPNGGGELQLFFRDVLVDRLVYPALPEGVSYGWMPGEDVPRTFCLPTPGEANAIHSPVVRIAGADEGESVSTINLSLLTLSGSIAKASCTWDFGDGYVSESCNPPAHAMRSTGPTTISVHVHDYCGNTLSQSLTVVVDPNAKPPARKKEKKKAPACTPSAFSGVTVTEFLPDPVGDDATGEWIELFYEGDSPAVLCGWSVDDDEGGSKPFRLDEVVLLPGAFHVISRPESKIALNNDKDAVRLIAPLPEGGTGMVLTIPYTRAPVGESFALREDGEWVWTPHPTPGEPNVFRSLDPWPGPSPIVISAALPDPEGKDEGSEWVELTNITDKPQWLLHGWELRTQAGAGISLHGTGFPPRATVRIALAPKTITLRNSDGAVLLTDPAGQPRSALAWRKTKAGQPIVPAEGNRCPLHYVTYEGSGIIRGRDAGGWVRRMEVPDLTVGRDAEEYSVIKHASEKFLVALLHKKNIELECDTDGQPTGTVFLDGQDILTALLRQGMAHVPGRDALPHRALYAVFETEAQREKRGVWRMPDAIARIDTLKERERLRAIVAREGVRLSVLPGPGLVEPGEELVPAANVPAVIYRETLAGSWEPFIEGVMIEEEGVVRLKAAFHDGDLVAWSDVVERRYILRRARYPRCITVTEVYPSPLPEEEEWVELYNQCDQDIALAGWTIDDEYPKGSKPVTLGIDQTIAARSYRVLTGSVLSKIAYNNTGDSVLLRSPDGRIAAAVTYPSVKKGWSYALVGEEYCLTQRPTPGAPNECYTAPKPPPKKKKTAPKKAMLGLATKYVVRPDAAQAAPVPDPLDPFRRLRGQIISGESGTLLPAAPAPSVPWQLLLASLLAVLTAGAWWGRGRR